MSLALKGTVTKIGDLQEYGNFKKKELLLRTDESSQYPQIIPVEVVNKSIGILDPVGVGDVIEVDINVRGNEHNGKHYISISGWRINIESKATKDVSALVTNEEPVDLNPTKEAEGDDLPF